MVSFTNLIPFLYIYFSFTTVTKENNITAVIKSIAPKTIHPIPIKEIFVIISCSTL